MSNVEGTPYGNHELTHVGTSSIGVGIRGDFVVVRERIEVERDPIVGSRGISVFRARLRLCNGGRAGFHVVGKTPRF